MIFKNKRDMESWVRERSIDTMKENPYLIENDFVEVASNGLVFIELLKMKQIYL